MGQQISKVFRHQPPNTPRALVKGSRGVATDRAAAPRRPRRLHPRRFGSRGRISRIVTVRRGPRRLRPPRIDRRRRRALMTRRSGSPRASTSSRCASAWRDESGACAREFSIPEHSRDRLHVARAGRTEHQQDARFCGFRLSAESCPSRRRRRSRRRGRSGPCGSHHHRPRALGTAIFLMACARCGASTVISVPAKTMPWTPLATSASSAAVPGCAYE